MPAQPTAQIMLDKLDIRIEDVGAGGHTPAEKMSLLSSAQRIIAGLLENAYLDELEVTTAAVDCADGTMDFSALNGGNVIFKGANGILRVKVIFGDAGPSPPRWADMIIKEEFFRNDNSYFQGSNERPLFNVHKQIISITAGDLVAATADVYLLDTPPAIALVGDFLTLNIAYEELIIGWAAGLIWEIDEKHTRAAAAQKAVLDQINQLNQRTVGK